MNKGEVDWHLTTLRTRTDMPPNSGSYLFAAVLPKALRNNENITIEVETVLTHATYAWPAHIKQSDQASMKFESDLFILSPYRTVVQRTKVR